MIKKSFKKDFVLYISLSFNELKKLYENFGVKHFLISYAYLKQLDNNLQEAMDWIADRQAKDKDFILMLDSGAFSMFTGVATVKDSEYINFIKKYQNYFDEIVMLDRKRPRVNEKLFNSLYKGISWYADHTVHTSVGKYHETEKIWESEDKVCVAGVSFLHKELFNHDLDSNVIEEIRNKAEKYKTKTHFLGTYSIRKIKLGMPHSVDVARFGDPFGDIITLRKFGDKFYMKRIHYSEASPELVRNVSQLKLDFNKSSDRRTYSILALKKLEEIINRGKLLSPKEYKDLKDLKDEELFLLKENIDDIKEGWIMPDIASKSIFVLSNKEYEIKENVKNIVEEEKSITYIPHFVSIVGSRVKNLNDKNSDLDILIRKDTRDESLELLISRYLKESNIHFIYSPYGPHSDYIPLFNLKLIPCESKLITLESYEFEPFKLFTPPKMGSAYSFEEYYDIEDLINQFAIPYFKEGTKFYVEPKVNGWRTIIHKKGNKIGMYFEGTDKNRIDNFEKLKKELLENKKDFIIDCELIAINITNGKIIPRKNLCIFNSNQKIDCDEFLTSENERAKIKLFAFDIPYFNKDISLYTLKERKKYLKQVKNKYIDEIDYYKAENSDELQKYIKIASSYPGSEGAVVKSLDSIYTPEEIPSWAKFKKILEFKVRVIDKEKTKDGRAYNYIVSYQIDNKEIELGKTMNTKLEAKIGDIITITAQEIQLFKNGDFRISAQIPVVQDIDLSRENPDHIKDIVYKAYKIGLLHTSDDIRKEFFEKFYLKEGWVTYKGRRFLISDMKDEETKTIREKYSNLKFIEAKGGGFEHALRHPEWNGDKNRMLNTIEETIKKGVVFKTKDTNNRERILFYSEKTNALVIAGEKGIFNSYIVSVPEAKEYVYRLTRDAKVGLGGRL